MKTSVIYIIKNYISSIINIHNNKASKQPLRDIFNAPDALTVTVSSRGDNYSSLTGEVTRIGNFLRIYYNAKRSSATGSGNITNELIGTLKVAKPSNYRSYWYWTGNTAGTGPVATTYAKVSSTDDNYIYISIYLTATHSAATSFSGYVLMPIYLNVPI